MAIRISEIDQDSESQISDWVAMRLQLWPKHTLEDLDIEGRELLRNQTQVVFLAYDDAKPAGFIEVSLRSIVNGADTSPVGFIEGIYVAEAFRLQGLAHKLENRAEDWARQQGCTEFGSDAEIWNTDSHKFHKAIGFRETDRTVNFIKKL